MKYSPNKTELWLCLIVLILASLATSIIFPAIINTKQLSIMANISLLIIILFLMVMGFQAIVNYIYVRYQRGF